MAGGHQEEKRLEALDLLEYYSQPNKEFSGSSTVLTSADCTILEVRAEILHTCGLLLLQNEILGIERSSNTICDNVLQSKNHCFQSRLCN